MVDQSELTLLNPWTSSRTLAEGERVESEVVQGQKGPAAEKMTKLNY